MMGGFSAVLLNDLFGGPDQGHASSLAVLVAMPVSNGIDISRFGRLVLVGYLALACIVTSATMMCGLFMES